MRDTNVSLAATTAFLGLEERLFAWDADRTARMADEFMCASMWTAPRTKQRKTEKVRRMILGVPDAPGGYACLGGETTVVRANDLALAMAVRLRTAA
jgi:hypothetical protein